MSKQIFLKNLGKRIVELRKERKISQTELAFKCGKDPQSIERAESGKINPSAYYLSEIAQGLNVPLKKLFEF